MKTMHFSIRTSLLNVLELYKDYSFKCTFKDVCMRSENDSPSSRDEVGNRLYRGDLGHKLAICLRQWGIRTV